MGTITGRNRSDRPLSQNETDQPRDRVIGQRVSHSETKSHSEIGVIDTTSVSFWDSSCSHSSTNSSFFG